MLFSSIPFLFYFFPAVLALYYLCSFSRLLQNTVLLLASLLFYAWGEPVNVVWMLLSILVNSVMGYLVRGGSRFKRRLFLTVDVLYNLGFLFFFKYLGFALEILSPVIGPVPFSPALPIGISFYTFQALSYVVDVYKGVVRPENPFYVGLYVSFFPQLIAGPIIQYKTVADQIRGRKSTFPMFSLGISRFVVGMGKKILLANCFAAVADNVFGWSAIGAERVAVPAMLAWLGSIAYTMQIYFDFSAYSDMAIGLGLCFGFKFGENFNYPYTAASVQDFWKRWHISLTDWFREYVYFPLGGSRVENQDHMVRNLFTVWLLTGIWHGANWTFILWGMYYFLLQLAERFFRYPDKIPFPALRHLYTLFIVNAGWVLFRADNLYQAGRFFLNMLGLNRNGFYSELAILLLRENWVFFLLGLVFCVPAARDVNAWLYQNPRSLPSWIFLLGYPVGLLLLSWGCVCYLSSGAYNPFIYFNF